LYQNPKIVINGKMYFIWCIAYRTDDRLSFRPHCIDDDGGKHKAMTDDDKDVMDDVSREAHFRKKRRSH
jgi:hypothetical protein